MYRLLQCHIQAHIHIIVSFFIRFDNWCPCLRKGISQEQLALDCNLNINTIGMIERGQKNPTIFTLQRICDGLGITLATLFLYEGDTSAPEEQTIQHIEAVLRQLPPRDLERVARILEELVNFGQ